MELLFIVGTNKVLVDGLLVALRRQFNANEFAVEKMEDDYVIMVNNDDHDWMQVMENFCYGFVAATDETLHKTMIARYDHV